MNRVVRAIRRTVALLVLAISVPANAQTFPFTSGPIPLCDTSTFTATVSGVGYLITPDGWNWGPYLDNVLLNITSNHPQTLSISLTSPAGTTLLLSAFNGAGGQNYTNTNFPYWGGNNIVGASAPFTGSYIPQGGWLSAFTNQNADGVWTITVIDTACYTGGSGGPGDPSTWVPGWFNGGAGTGAFAFGFSSPPPPCFYDMGWQQTTLCPGETADIITYYNNNWGAWSGVTFNVWEMWTGAAVPDPSNVSTPGSYQIEGYDWTGCTYFGTYEVIAAPGIALGPDQTIAQCSGSGPVDLTALFTTTGATSMSWSLDGSAIPAATAMAATAPGVYELNAANQGCNDVAQVTLTIGNSPVLGADQSVSICEGSSADLTVLFPASAGTGTWSLGGSMITPPTVAASAAVYSYSVITPDGCTDTATVTLNVQALPVLGSDSDVSVCDGSTADLTTLYPTAGLNTQWTLNGTAVANPAAVTDAGTYVLTATDALGCASSATTSLTLWATPALGADAAATICTGATVDLTSFFDATGLTAVWTQASATVVDPTTVSTAGIYTLNVTDGNSCSDAANVTVTVVNNPVLGNDAQVNACEGTTVDLTTLFNTMGTTVAWTQNGTPVTDPTAVDASGDYLLTATNSTGCSTTATATVTMDAAPNLGADQSVDVCEGNSFDLTNLFNTTGLTSAWSSAGNTVATPSAITDAGTYQLHVSNTAGCTDEAHVIFTVNAAPDLGGDLFFTLCPWQTVDLSTAFPVGYMNASYTSNGMPLDTPTAVVDSGLYVVTVTDWNGCMDTAHAVVQPIDCLCEADIVHDARCMQEPAHFTLIADSAVVGAHWNFEDAAASTNEVEPVVRFLREKEVLVTVDVQLTCGTVNIQRTVRIEDCTDSCSVFVPNAFTPDSDGRNDLWSWKGECVPQEFSLEVFNRFGELVFATQDPAVKWDGSYKGVTSPDGVYVFHAGYRLLYQKRKEVTGTVTLLR